MRRGSAIGDGVGAGVIFIDFGMDFDIIFDGLLMPFPFAHATGKTFKKQCFCNESTCFYIQDNMILCDFHDVFATSLGIDL